MDGKKEQLEAAKRFGNALFKLRKAGILINFRQEGVKEVIELVDRDTGQHVGEYATISALYDVTGQLFDEYMLSEDYFGSLGN